MAKMEYSVLNVSRTCGRKKKKDGCRLKEFSRVENNLSTIVDIKCIRVNESA